MKKILSFMFVVVLLLLPTSVHAVLTADDFIRQAPASVSDETKKEERRQVQKPVETIPASKENATISPTISAQSVQDAINTFVKSVHEDGIVGRCGIDFPGGHGVVAAGSATYDIFENPVATRASRRQAHTSAYLRAKRELTEWAEGQMTEWKAFIADNTDSIITENENLHNIMERCEEYIKTGVDGIVRNHMIYDVNVDDKYRQIFVTIVSVPALWDGASIPGPYTIVANSSKSGLNRALSEINNNIAFPVGGARIYVPDTGEIIFVGYGSAVVDFSKNEAAQAKLANTAQRKARIRAQVSLFNMFSERERLQGMSEMEETESRAILDLQKLSEDDLTGKIYPTDYGKLEKQRDYFRNSSLFKEILNAESKGNLPPGVDQRSWLDKNREYAYSVAVYTFRANP